MTKPVIEPMLTPAEVATMFGVTVQTVGRWAKIGRLPFILTPGGVRRYPEAGVRALKESGGA